MSCPNSFKMASRIAHDILASRFSQCFTPEVTAAWVRLNDAAIVGSDNVVHLRATYIANCRASVKAALRLFESRSSHATPNLRHATPCFFSSSPYMFYIRTSRFDLAQHLAQSCDALPNQSCDLLIVHFEFLLLQQQPAQSLAKAAPKAKGQARAAFCSRDRSNSNRSIKSQASSRESVLVFTEVFFYSFYRLYDIHIPNSAVCA